MNENDGHPLYDEHELQLLDTIGGFAILAVVAFFLLYLGYHIVRWWL